MRNILYAQLILVPLVAGVALLAYGQRPALAALYGGGIAVVNTLLMLRRIVNATRTLDKDPKADVRSLYAGALERFVFTLVAMAAGMGWLMLHPLALLAGFGLAHLAYPLNRGMANASG